VGVRFPLPAYNKWILTLLVSPYCLLKYEGIERR